MYFESTIEKQHRKISRESKLVLNTFQESS